MLVRFIGCGDAFGSGGRFNTCFQLLGSRTNVLIDCGASSLIAMKQQGRIAEAYFYEKHVALHLDLKSLERYLDEIRPKRLVLTHMSDEMLARVAGLTHQCAHDGMVIDLPSVGAVH